MSEASATPPGVPVPPELLTMIGQKELMIYNLSTMLAQAQAEITRLQEFAPDPPASTS